MEVELAQMPLVIHAPHTLPMYREPRPTKKHKTDGVPARSSKADAAGMVSATPGSGGRIGAPAKTLLTQFIMKNQVPSPYTAEEHCPANSLSRCNAMQGKMAYLDGGLAIDRGLLDRVRGTFCFLNALEP